MFVLAIRSGEKIFEESHALSDVVIFNSINTLPQLAQPEREERLRERVGWFYSEPEFLNF
jgi:hypothetical protein